MSVLSEVGNDQRAIICALRPVGQLAEGNETVTITGPVVTSVPVSEDQNSGQTNIGTDKEISNENTRSNNRFITIEIF